MLLQDANPRDLERAAALNHKVLFRQEAAALGGRVFTADGLEWTSGDVHIPSMVAFPELEPETAAEKLDKLMAYYVRHPPKGAGCWSLPRVG